jgi:hypothetical protein
MNIRCSGFRAVLLVAFAALPAHAMAAPNRGYVFDNRYQHGHYYPQRGLSFNMLPPGGVSVSYRGSPFIFHGGAWYRPYGSRFVVVAPPLGIGINLLPPYYTTLWFGGIPYYYADNTYYSWRPERRQYVVTTPPDGVGSSTAAPTRNPDLFAYPKNGQTEAIDLNVTSGRMVKPDLIPRNRWVACPPARSRPSEWTTNMPSRPVLNRAVTQCTS